MSDPGRNSSPAPPETAPEVQRSEVRASASDRDDALVLWELEGDERLTRCIAVAHPDGLELRISGGQGESVWNEVFPSYAALMVRAREGRERLEAQGWRPKERPLRPVVQETKPPSRTIPPEVTPASPEPPMSADVSRVNAADDARPAATSARNMDPFDGLDSSSAVANPPVKVDERSAQTDEADELAALQPALLAPPTVFPPKCSACGSLNVFAVGVVPFASFRQRWLCAECKRTWKGIRWSKVLLVAGAVFLLTLAVVLV